MKKALPFAFYFIPMLALAQGTFAPLGAEWFYTYTNNYTFNGYTHYKVEKDTLLLGKACKKITVFVEGKMAYLGGPINTRFDPPLFLYEENAVLYLFDGSNAFDTLVDFNAVPGDGWDLSSQSCDTLNRVTVVETGSSLINGKNLKWVYFKFNDFVGNALADTFYQEIGSIRYSIKPHDYCLDPLSHDAYPQGLRCYFSNGYEYIRTDKDCDYYYTSLGPDYRLAHNFIVFPNPVTNQLQIQAVTPQAASVKLLAYDGRLVLEENFSGRLILDLQGLAQGVYVLQISENDRIEVKRIVKH